MTRGAVVEGIDYDKIALTLDLLARAEREAVRDAMRQLLLNALKLRYSGDERARRLWELGASDATRALGERMGASLYTHVLDHLGELYAEARRVAAADLEGHGEFDAASRLPHTCPWTTDELLRE